MDYMARALALAERARDRCSPNPGVGAVLVRDGRVVGEGGSQRRGQAHAEIVALAQAGEQARGATLYVTLEPCSHIGLTGPCAEQLIAANVAAVRCAMLDPSPWVNGQGRQMLEAAGIGFELGERADEARALNRDYLHWLDHRRPYVTAKYAMTLDGRIATHIGSSRWISGPPARALVGAWRSRSNAVLVGIGTVLADDPSLTARGADDQLLPCQPLRVVLDSRGRLPRGARLVSGQLPGHTLIATTPAGQRALGWLAASSAELWVGQPGPDGRVQPAELLAELGSRPMISALVEAGSTLLAALLEQRLVDELAAFVAPKLVGGCGAPGPVGGKGIADMAAALPLVDVTFERLGDDLLVRGRPSYPADPRPAERKE